MCRSWSMKISTDESSTTAHAPIYSDSQLINSARFNKEEDEIFFIRAQNCYLIRAIVTTWLGFGCLTWNGSDISRSRYESIAYSSLYPSYTVILYNFSFMLSSKYTSIKSPIFKAVKASKSQQAFHKYWESVQCTCNSRPNKTCATIHIARKCNFTSIAITKCDKWAAIKASDNRVGWSPPSEGLQGAGIHSCFLQQTHWRAQVWRNNRKTTSSLTSFQRRQAQHRKQEMACDWTRMVMTAGRPRGRQEYSVCVRGRTRYRWRRNTSPLGPAKGWLMKVG